MSTETEQDIESMQVRLRKDGTLIQRIDGKEITVATYDRNSGHLEFETKEYSVKLYNQVTAKIGTVDKGTRPSGMVIKTIGIKGDARPDLKALPKKPKLGPLGDTAEEYVQWMLDNDMTQAIVRYGIYTDANGKPIRKNVKRSILSVRDARDEGKPPAPQPVIGQSHEGGPIQAEKEIFTEKNAIIARRATPLTFTPQEVVGGFQPDEDFSDSEDGGDE